ncbi:MAG TPA: helix-turn-helix transcriptional regulator [Solirubrobacterales bacterium]|nr:helix-turn-helix transcriptional regulator [Solirubrobacterales bacterium]
MAIRVRERLALRVLSSSLQTPYASLGRALRFLRDEAGMSQDEVAYISDIGSSYISNLENGKVNPTFSTLKRLARALEVDCSKILTLEEIFARGAELAKSEPLKSR